MDKLIITAAICGAEVTKEYNPHVPYTVDEIAEEARLACIAGASIIHLHVREDNGKPTQSKMRFKACIKAIRKVCPDVIIQPSTGGAVGMSNEERLQPLQLKPEMATLDCGTLNFGGDDVFLNTENTIIHFANEMLEIGTKPELEVFDQSMILTALRLAKDSLIHSPLHFNFVMGVGGGIGGSEREFNFLVGSLPENATFTVSGIGRYEFPLAELAIKQGGHVRVGFEDNIYIEPKILATSNAQLVTKVVELAKKYDRRIASPNEARQILSLKGR